MSLILIGCLTTLILCQCVSLILVSHQFIWDFFDSFKLICRNFKGVKLELDWNLSWIWFFFLSGKSHCLQIWNKLKFLPVMRPGGSLRYLVKALPVRTPGGGGARCGRSWKIAGRRATEACEALRARWKQRDERQTTRRRFLTRYLTKKTRIKSAWKQTTSAMSAFYYSDQ